MATMSDYGLDPILDCGASPDDDYDYDNSICPTCGSELFSCSACDGYGFTGREGDESGRAAIECEKCEGTGVLQSCEECGWSSDQP
jgi:predicted RNA-binding Zn-ribbon protein involved in translation (DUF1610 family)